jgi:RHS repeat-associated protein
MSEENQQLYHYHGDHLGSAQIVTDPEGKIYEQLEYTPYGELWVEHVPVMETTPFRFTGKERDSETGLYYFGTRYLNPQTGMWLSADPAMGEYIPQAPINDDIRKQNQNLPGMGGVFNYVNLHAYHYAGNNPVVLKDPDGRYLGFKQRARTFQERVANVPKVGGKQIMSMEEYLHLVSKYEPRDGRSDIRRDSRRAATSEFDMQTLSEVEDYSKSETARYDAFNDVRGSDLLTYGAAQEILDTAESVYKQAESYAEVIDKKPAYQAKRYAENEANKVIDEFIKNHKPDYIVPSPIQEEK